MKKQVLSLLLVMLMVVSLVPMSALAATTYYINGVAVRYDDFSSSPNECWVYANNIYNKIWGHNFTNSFSDSENSLRNLSDSELTLTAAHLKAYVSNAAIGSCLRICNGEYLHGSDGWGHSQIIVQKDDSGFTVFEGGLSNYPYCREKYYTWNEYVNTGWLGGTYSYIKYVKWPGAGSYKDPDQPVITGSPVIKSEKSAYEAGESVTLQRNTVNNTNYYWIVLYRNGKQILSTAMDDAAYTLSNPAAGSYEVYLQVGNATSGTITSAPYQFYVVNRIQGEPYIYTSQYSYYDDDSITLYRNTVEYTNYHWLTLYFNGEMILSSDMDEETYKIENAQAGTYTAYIQVGNLLGKKTSKECNFVVKCRHNWDAGEIAESATCMNMGTKVYTCNKCGDKYTDSIPSLGHNYKNGTCTRCGVKDPNYKPQANFTDVAAGSYCYDAVQWAVANGITNGTDATHFSPNAGCTRGQVVTFLWRAAGEPTVGGNVGFVDVAPGSYCYEAVKWAVANGITNGTDATHFSPNAACTRGQVVTFMYRAEGEPAVGGNVGFVDVAAGSYCYNAVQWAVANGITKGTDATHFSPNATCTRGQVVTFLYRAQ